MHSAPFAGELHTATMDVLKSMPGGQAAFGMGCDALRQIELHGCRRSARRTRAQLHNGANCTPTGTRKTVDWGKGALFLLCTCVKVCIDEGASAHG